MTAKNVRIGFQPVAPINPNAQPHSAAANCLPQCEMVRSGRAVCLVSMFAWNATAALLFSSIMRLCKVPKDDEDDRRLFAAGENRNAAATTEISQFWSSFCVARE